MSKTVNGSTWVNDQLPSEISLVNHLSKHANERLHFLSGKVAGNWEIQMKTYLCI